MDAQEIVQQAADAEPSEDGRKVRVKSDGPTPAAAEGAQAVVDWANPLVLKVGDLVTFGEPVQGLFGPHARRDVDAMAELKALLHGTVEEEQVGGLVLILGELFQVVGLYENHYVQIRRSMRTGHDTSGCFAVHAALLSKVGCYRYFPCIIIRCNSC
jgi:hypothetical protein